MNRQFISGKVNSRFRFQLTFSCTIVQLKIYHFHGIKVNGRGTRNGYYCMIKFERATLNIAF